VPHQIAQDASLYLSGDATDDAGDSITGRHLRWYLKRRLLGIGQSISVAGLPAGKLRITLVARDARGRTATASVTVRAREELPQFLALCAPARVSQHARRLVFRVSSLAPAILTVTSSTTRRVRIAVNRRANRVIVHIVRPGRRSLRLQLKLTSGRLHTIRTLVVRR
jgi:hypothetical protein